MKPDFQHWTVAVAGQWNTRLFGPEWVIANLSGGEQVNAELLLATGLANLRLHWGGLILIPQQEMIIIGVKEGSDQTLQKAEELAIKILELLPHTPVQGCGINFGFTDADPPSEMLGLFRLQDSDKISDLEAAIKATEIKRQLEFKNEDYILNLTCSMGEKGVGLHLNYHYGVNSTSLAAKALAGKTVRHKSDSLKIIESLYNLLLESEEKDDG
ncbi:MAG TPA: hypothetical protein VEF34_00460 [Syntrophobacteraceae bacterium]|nr:hypothetical protein [Syntrophobacteraceae bacterium]